MGLVTTSRSKLRGYQFGGGGGGGLSAAGVTGTIAADQQITIVSDGTHNFGSTGPTIKIFDDYRNVTVGVAPSVGSPVIGAYTTEGGAQPIEGIGHASGDNQTNGRGLLMTYITASERTTKGGARQMAIDLGSQQKEIYIYDRWKGVQWPTLTGSCAKWVWLFEDTSYSELYNICTPTFHNTENSMGFQGNSNGGAANFGFDSNLTPPSGQGLFSNSKYVKTGSANVWETHLRLHATDANSDQGRFRATCATSAYDTGLFTKKMSGGGGNSGLGGRNFQLAHFPGWHGDTGNDTRVSGNSELVRCALYVAYGPAAPARVMIGNGSTLATCTDLAICTIDSWSNTSITATIRNCGFSSLAGKYIYVFDANGDVIAYNAVTGRLIS